MRYQVKDIMRDVRVALDMNNTGQALIEAGDTDTLSLDEIIRSKIADAARIVELNAPVHLLDGGRAFGDSIAWESAWGYGMGMIHLPDDFLRLIIFQMSDWEKPVTEAITPENPKYAMQRSRYGVKGCPQKPVVAVITEPINQVLEFYTCTGGEGTYIKQARYMPIPRIVGENIELCEKLKPAIVYYTAFMVAQVINDTRAESLLNQSKELMK